MNNRHQLQLKKSKPTYKQLKSLVGQLQQQKALNTYVNKEQMQLESESETGRSVKRVFGQVSVFLRFLLYLMQSLLVTSMGLLLSLMVVFVILVMYVKDWLVERIRLCWGVCYQVLKKLQVPSRK